MALTVAAVSALWSFGGDYLAGAATDVLNRSVLGEGSRAAIGALAGFPLHHIVLEDVRLDQSAPDTAYSFLAADELHVTYDLWGVLNGRYAVSRLEAKGLRLELRTFQDGPIRLPRTRGSGGEKTSGGGGLPDFWVKNLVLEDASLELELPWRMLEVDSIQADLVVRSGEDGLRLEVEHLRGTIRDTKEVLELTRGVLFTEGPLRLEDFEGTWGGSPFRVSGPLDDPDLAIEVSDFPLDRFGQFLGLDVLAPGFVEHVKGSITERPDGLALEWDGSARWSEWDARELAGRGLVTDDALALRDVLVRTEGGGVSEASIDIPLHRPELSIRGRFQDLHTRTLRVESLKDWPGVLNGRGTVRLMDRDDPLRRVDARLELERGHLLEVPFVSGVVTGRITDGSWGLDTVRVNLEQARLDGRGTIGTDTIDLSFAYRGDLRPWRSFLRRQGFGGDGRLQVRLFGDKKRPVLQAHGGMSNVRLANVSAEEVELEKALGVVANGRRLAIAFTAPRGVNIAGTRFSRASGNLVVTEDRVIMDELQIDSGDTSMTVAGTLKWEPVIEVELDRAQAIVDGRRFWMDEPGTLVFDGTVLSTPGVRVQTPRGSFALDGSLDTKTRFVDAHCRVDAVDPSVFFAPDAPPRVAVGKITGTLDVKGSVPNLDGRGELGLREIDWQGGHIDSATVTFGITDNVLTVERLEPIVKNGKILVFGEVQFGAPVYETGAGIARGEPPDPERTTLDLNLEIMSLSLDRWRFLLPNRERAVGMVDASIAVSGSSAEPRIRFKGEAKALGWKEFTADTLRADGSFAEGTLTLDRLHLRQEGMVSGLVGSFPVDLQIYPFRWEIPAREMRLLVDMEEGSLQNLNLTPWLEGASGNLKARVLVSGTPQSPVLSGEAKISEGRVEIEGRDEVVTDVTALIRFDGDLILIEDAQGRVGVTWSDPRKVGGLVTAKGTYRLGAEENETYELLIHADKAVVGQEGEYAARVSGDLTLKPERGSDGKIYPFARGTLVADRVEYGGSLEPQDIGEFKPKSILYSVEVDAPRIFLRTEDVEAELGGELTVHQDVERQTIFGELEIYRCSYQFFQKTFRTTEGRLIWNRADSRIPDLDVTAETKEAGYLIQVVLTGPVDKPVIEFSAQNLGSDGGADLTQEQIVQLLTWGSFGLSPLSRGVVDGRTQDQLDGSEAPTTSDQVLVGTSKFFLGPLEDALRREIGMVDEVEIQTEDEAGGYFSPTVGVTKYVTSELALRYRQGLSGTYEQELGVEYRLRRTLFLRGGMSNRQLTGRGAAQEYNLDLKFRLDY